MSTSTPDIQKEFYTVAVTSGDGSVALPIGMAHKLLQVIVIAPVSTYSYYVYIEETMDSLEIFRREDDLIGTYNEILSPCVPLFGNHTFYITSASGDGNYKVRVVYE